MSEHAILVKKTDEELNNLTNEAVRRVLEAVRLNIVKIMLYGSYARGEADEESDVDIMILCDDPKEAVQEWREKVSVIGSGLSLDYDVFVSFHMTDKNTFDKYREAMPFFQNVLRDGVSLYG